jgi:hypothetical protein
MGILSGFKVFLGAAKSNKFPHFRARKRLVTVSKPLLVGEPWQINTTCSGGKNILAKIDKQVVTTHSPPKWPKRA